MRNCRRKSETAATARVVMYYRTYISKKTNGRLCLGRNSLAPVVALPSEAPRVPTAREAVGNTGGQPSTGGVQATGSKASTRGGNDDTYGSAPPNITWGDGVQYFSVRQTFCQCGHISITEHFKEWASLGMPLGKMASARLLTEVRGGVGSANYTSAALTAK